MKDDILKPGYYRYTPGRGHQPAPAGIPDAVICRRVADFPHGRPPAGAAITDCVKCGVPIAYNPRGPHQDKPHVCMPCEHIQPLPIEDPS